MMMLFDCYRITVEGTPSKDPDLVQQLTRFVSAATVASIGESGVTHMLTEMQNGMVTDGVPVGALIWGSALEAVL